MTRLKNTRAFTLIELIVVIVIIGILVAIAAVSYNSFIANSKKTGAETQAAQVGKIIQATSATQQKVLTEAEAVALDFVGDGVKATVEAGTAADGKVLVTYDTYEACVTLPGVAGGPFEAKLKDAAATPAVTC